MTPDPLPTTPEVPSALTDSRSANALRLPSGLRVLCVDDNEDAADSLGTLLTMVGCATVVTHDAASALAQVEQFRPQAGVLDITMPGMDGCELARRLRAGPGGKEMLLIALTALGDHNSLERIADSGFDLYFAKPVPPRELYAVLNDFIERGRPA